jgi:hypothetical protein
MTKLVFAVVTVAALAASSSAFAQLQEWPQIPREWYSEVVLWNYGDNNRPERYAAGCLRWGPQTRTWYDICRAGGPRRDTVSVRY